MKKKELIIGVIAVILIVVGAILLFSKAKLKNDEVSIITLDINPSIEMTIRGEKVEKVKALNEDANEIINGIILLLLYLTLITPFSIKHSWNFELIFLNTTSLNPNKSPVCFS